MKPNLSLLSPGERDVYEKVTAYLKNNKGTTNRDALTNTVGMNASAVFYNARKKLGISGIRGPTAGRRPKADGAPKDGTITQRYLEYTKQNPNAGAAQIADYLGVNKDQVYSARYALNKKLKKKGFTVDKEYKAEKRAYKKREPKDEQINYSQVQLPPEPIVVPGKVMFAIMAPDQAQEFFKLMVGV
jgi:hypothetical protein